MKRRSLALGLMSLALACLATPAMAGGVWDQVNSGQHEPTMGAVVLANGIASTDVLFLVCGWPDGDWAPLRERTIAVAPKLFAKAGLNPEGLDAMIARARETWRRSAQFANTCSAPHAKEKRLRWARALVDWATSPDAP